MIKYFSEALKITNNNIILATPLILFMLILSIYSNIIHSAGIDVAFLGTLTSVLMWAAFLAGWFYIIRQSILIHYENISKEEKVQKSFSLMGLMIKGIGEYFVPVFFIISIEIFFFVILAIIIYYIGINFIGNLNIPVNDLLNAVKSNSATEINTVLDSISRIEIIKLAKWIYFCIFSCSIFLFITFFWGPATLKDTKNVFKSFWLSNKFLWTNFLNTIVFFILCMLINFVGGFVCGLMTSLPVLSFLALLINFYLMVYIMVLVFLFYEKYEK